MADFAAELQRSVQQAVAEHASQAAQASCPAAYAGHPDQEANP